jgi:hypothetical protein
VLAQWTGADTPSAELDIVEIAHRRTASAAATDSPGRAKLRSPIHLRPIPNADHVRDPHRILDGWPPPRADSPRVACQRDGTR